MENTSLCERDEDHEDIVIHGKYVFLEGTVSTDPRLASKQQLVKIQIWSEMPKLGSELVEFHLRRDDPTEIKFATKFPINYYPEGKQTYTIQIYRGLEPNTPVIAQAVFKIANSDNSVPDSYKAIKELGSSKGQPGPSEFKQVETISPVVLELAKCKGFRIQETNQDDCAQILNRVGWFALGKLQVEL